MTSRYLKNNIRKLIRLALLGKDARLPIRNWYQYYFDRYKQERTRQRPGTLTNFIPPYISGLVSIVLPVYNGEKHIGEAIESILAQTYKNFELIIVNDGSTDSSPTIIDNYAERDERIRVIHQENQKLPRSLSNGFRVARGEFLTWTSDDNRLKPNCLERLVACLERHENWDMVYANMDIIGEDGQLLKNSDWYCNYQVPPGSGHVHLPEDTHELNVWPNQYIGAAFMYRARVAALLRDYSPYRFTIEDYDYFMQVNEFFNLRHVDFKDTIYEYRFHDSSLTSKEKELQILKQREYLMVFDDFRRDFNLTPVWWVIDTEKGDANSVIASDLKSLAEKSGDLIEDLDKWSLDSLPRLWFPCIYVKILKENEPLSISSRPNLPKNAAKVLVLEEGITPPETTDKWWDLCITLKDGASVHTQTPFQGWHTAKNANDIFLASEIFCRKKQFETLEKEIFEPSSPEYKFSVIICTYKRTHILEKAVTSILKQDFSPGDYEIIIVNNDPENDLSGLIHNLKTKYTSDGCPPLKLVLCPFKGLSHARNAGISRAQGDIICFLDDDAVAEPDLLSEIEKTYRLDPNIGLVGGKILVQVPEPKPDWLEDEALVFWSHFDPPFDKITCTDNWWEFPWGANWTAKRKALLEIGGFRCRYGRKGNDFGGGEELLAGCLIHRLGYKVAINPKAKVTHLIDPVRFTKEHVKKTIKSALLVNYRLQTDLYMPRWMDAKEAAVKTSQWTKDLLSYFTLSPYKRLKVKSNIAAHMALLRLIAEDYRKRIQKQEQ